MGKIGLVAIHYPRAGEQAFILALVRDAAEVMRTTSGCLSADYWLNPADGSVVTTGQWDSEESLHVAFSAVHAAGIPINDDSHEERPRTVLQLVSASGVHVEHGR